MNAKQAQWKALSSSHKICEPGLTFCVCANKKWTEATSDFGRKETLKAHNFPLPEICLSRCQNHIFVSLVNGTSADANCVNLNKSAYNNLNILPPTI